MAAKIGVGVFVLLALGTGLFLFRASLGPFSVQGAFEDEDRNRIYTIVFDPEISEREIGEHAAGLESTQGQSTAAYFYPDHSAVPRDGVTFASSTEQANHVIYESRGFGPWRFAFLRDAKGATRFVDCNETPDDLLCRRP